MAVAQLTVYSPNQARVGQVLSPAITVQYLNADPTVIYFATPVLLSGTGTVVEALQGNRAVTGMPINGGATIQFSFTDLTISAPGTYNIRVDLWIYSEGANFVAQTDLTPIEVSN